MIVILGPAPCHTCGAPVTVVRRDVEQPCDGCDLQRHIPYHSHPHTHTIRDVGPFTTVDDDGTRHECESNR